MKLFSQIFIASIVSLILIIQAQAAQTAETISAPAALSAVEKGSMILLDIRTPQEWKETGIASVAIPLTMHSGEFLNGFQKVVIDNPGKKIGIICATGGRTLWLQAELAKRGLEPVIDVSEGMMGSKAGPGWIARGLALKKIK